ncbi:MAG: iron-containing alcohol dehydrogenase [Candidatus Hydrogenedentes bacterium]|nr:iron-containing alcohol dehydrogenase [Candidatus Hydrogenedentota bacterium]
MNTLPDTLILPPETRLGRGASQQLLELCDAFGGRGCLVCGQSQVRSGALDKILDKQSSDVELRVWLHPGSEPTLEQLEDLLEIVRAHNPQWVAAIGGGSVLDIAKAAAGLHHAPMSVLSYHDGQPIPPSPTSFIAVPTTAGTGSEATMVSVLTNSDTGVKKSIRHPSFLARLVLLDPDLLESCPKEVLAASGMDALTQAIESYCSRGATWLSDTFALEGLRLIHGSLDKGYQGDSDAFLDLMNGSYLAGIALSNARLGLVHGLAHPLGARFHTPHGLVCAVCLPPVLAFNREVISEKYARMSEIVGEDLLAYAQSMVGKLGIRNPFAGKALHDPETVIEETLASGSTKANPRPVAQEDVSTLLNTLFQAEA